MAHRPLTERERELKQAVWDAREHWRQLAQQTLDSGDFALYDQCRAARAAEKVAQAIFKAAGRQAGDTTTRARYARDRSPADLRTAPPADLRRPRRAAGLSHYRTDQAGRLGARR